MSSGWEETPAAAEEAADVEPAVLDPARLEDPPAGAAEGPPVPFVVGVCALAWALPGAGHLLVRQYGRAALFGVLILLLFLGGLALDGKVYRPLSGEPLTYLAALGASGIGLPFVVIHLGGWADGDLHGRWFEYGSTFTLVAGLLNLVVVLDAYDFAVGRKR